METVAVVGHVCVDLRPELPPHPSLTPGSLVGIGPLEVSIGGAVANTGRVLAALGVPVEGWAAVGRDDLGEILTRRLGELAGFSFHPQPAAAGTSYSVVIEPAGVDRLFWHHLGANAALDLAAIDLGEAALVHLGYPSLVPPCYLDGGAALAGFLARAAAAGRVTSLDLAGVDPATAAGAVDWRALFARVLPSTDILSPSYDDLAGALGLESGFDPDVARDLAGQLLDWGAAVVTISAGSRGMLLAAAGADRLEPLTRLPGFDPRAWAGSRHSYPAPPLARQTTTTGAGDSASAGLLAAILAGSGPTDALDRALSTAARVIEVGGPGLFASSRIPTRQG